MAQTTGNEGAPTAADIAAAARDRGLEELEGAKGQLAEGAERIAAAVERTSDELDAEADGALSGFGRSVATLMRQLAGGLQERDVDEFARELGALARRNPGVFLAGSVAVGFGIVRFFKARTPLAATRGGARWQDADGWDRSGAPELDSRNDFDADESLDMSEGVAPRDEQDGGAAAAAGGGAAERGAPETAARDDEGNPSKSRQSSKQPKQKPKPQRAASPPSDENSGTNSIERPPTDGPSSGAASDSTATGGAGGAASRGGKS